MTCGREGSYRSEEIISKVCPASAAETEAIVAGAGFSVSVTSLVVEVIVSRDASTLSQQDYLGRWARFLRDGMIRL